jgi:hypothetical protein
MLMMSSLMAMKTVVAGRGCMIAMAVITRFRFGIRGLGFKRMQ